MGNEIEVFHPKKAELKYSLFLNNTRMHGKIKNGIMDSKKFSQFCFIIS
jgi:hypothetical protein